MRTDSSPWYRQFWPWFVIALPAASVVLGFTTLFVAVRDADSLVRDDYYDAGLTINRDFDREREAARLGLRATLSLDAEGTLGLALEGEGADDIVRLSLYLDRPNDAGRDLRLVLERDASGAFAPATALPDLGGRWDATVLPEGEAWRLASRVELARGRAAGMAAAP